MNSTDTSADPSRSRPGSPDASISNSPAWGVLRWIYRQLAAASSWPIDLVLGTRTTRFEPLGNLFGGDSGLYRSRSTTWLTLFRTFRRLDIQTDDALIDVGCGAGRVVVAASLLPFRRVVGVEFDPSLCAQAERNLTALRFGCRERREIIQADALAHGVPEDVTVLYLANPFQAEVFETFMLQVLASADRAPRRLRLVYFNPIEHARLMATGRFRLVDSFSGWRPDRSWRRSLTTNIYDVQPPPSGLAGRSSGAASVTAGAQACART